MQLTTPYDASISPTTISRRPPDFQFTIHVSRLTFHVRRFEFTLYSISRSLEWSVDRPYPLPFARSFGLKLFVWPIQTRIRNFWVIKDINERLAECPERFHKYNFLVLGPRPLVVGQILVLVSVHLLAISVFVSLLFSLVWPSLVAIIFSYVSSLRLHLHLTLDWVIHLLPWTADNVG